MHEALSSLKLFLLKYQQITLMFGRRTCNLFYILHQGAQTPLGDKMGFLIKVCKYVKNIYTTYHIYVLCIKTGLWETYLPDT